MANFIVTNLIFGFLPDKILIGYFSSQRDIISFWILIDFHTEISLMGPRITRVRYFDLLLYQMWIKDFDKKLLDEKFDAVM